jgi:hypothetical protein
MRPETTFTLIWMQRATKLFHQWVRFYSFVGDKRNTRYAFTTATLHGFLEFFLPCSV